MGKGSANIKILHTGIVEGVVDYGSLVICVVNWLVLEKNIEVDSKGAFASIHGPIQAREGQGYRCMAEQSILTVISRQSKTKGRTDDENRSSCKGHKKENSNGSSSTELEWEPGSKKRFSKEQQLEQH